MKGKKNKKRLGPFEIMSNYSNSHECPVLLFDHLLHNPSLLGQMRAVEMLDEWIQKYKKLNDVQKQPYAKSIIQLEKLILPFIENHLSFSVKSIKDCYQLFYMRWVDFNKAVNNKLLEHNGTTLEFFCQLTMSFVYGIDPQPQAKYNSFLSNQFEPALLNFQPVDFVSTKQLIRTIRMLNIQRPQIEFVQHIEEWVAKLEKISSKVSKSKEIQIKLEMIAQIVSCRSFLTQKVIGRRFWQSEAKKFYKQLLKIGIWQEKNKWQDKGQSIMETFATTMIFKEMEPVLMDMKDEIISKVLWIVKPNRVLLIFLQVF